MTEYYTGRVHSVIFENAGQAFYILKIKIDDADDAGPASRSFRRERDDPAEDYSPLAGALVTIRGNIPGLNVDVGTWFGFEGKWVKHPEYGRQIEITRAPVIRGPWTVSTIKKILSAHGVGRLTLQILSDHFGDEMETALGDAERLQEVRGIDQLSAEHIVSRWQAVKAMFQALSFLSEFDLPKVKIDRVWSLFGDRVEQVLAEDPWSLVQIDGIEFKQADEIAMRMGLSLDSDKRIRGAVLHMVKSRRGMGHLYMLSGDLFAAVKEIIPNVTTEQIAHTLKACHQEGAVTLDRKTKPGTVAIYEPWPFLIEDESAKLLVERMERAQICGEDIQEYTKRLGEVGVKTAEHAKENPLDLEGTAKLALDEWTGGSKVSLERLQMQAALNALIHPVSIITGSPGTGKTFCLRTVVRVLQDAGVSFLLVAPTGIAAKRVQSVTGSEASTIHRAFQARGIDGEDDRESTYAGIVGTSEGASGDGSGELWGYDEGSPHPAEVLIVDESSMVDQHLLYRILSCTQKKCRIVFVGDAAQLPPVGPGNVLRDMIATELFPVTRLTEIYRQEDTSDIVLAAHAINSGEIPQPTPGKTDFALFEIQTEEKVLETLLATVMKLYDKHANFQVLSPRHAGTLGVTNLNSRIRGLLNPKQPGLREMRLGAETVREGDRVMVVKNNYQYDIFNGDVGKIVRLDRKKKEVKIRIWGPPETEVFLPFRTASSHLRLAYAITCHKCLHPDTLVETTKGLLPIASLPGAGMVGAPGGPRAYERKVVNPEAPMLKITTKDGYSVSVTPDHGLDVWDAETETYERKVAQGIKIGDFLRLRMRPELDAIEPAVLPSPPQETDVRTRLYSVPSVLNNSGAEFLGLFVADGTLSPAGFRLAKRHREVVDRFAELCRELFGVEASRFHELGAYHAEVSSVFLSQWLSRLGGLLPHAKDVPSCVLQSPVEVQRWFLRGLFEDGSVHLRSGDPTKLDHIELASKFAGVREKVRVLLLRMGIIAGRTTSRTPSLQLYGVNARKFGEEIGFITREKQERARLAVGPERYVFPCSRRLVKALRAELGSRVPLPVYRNGINRGCISRHAAAEILKYSTGTQAQRELASFLEDHHSVVASVEPCVSSSVCVEVPDGHRFLQNGFYGWNSQGQEYDVILMPWVSGFRRQLQRNLIYTAITRARRKVCLFGHPTALARAVGNREVDTRNTLFPDRLIALAGCSSEAAEA